MTPARPRLGWADLPQIVRRQSERKWSARVESEQRCSGGYTAGVASRLRLDDGRPVFVKAIPNNDCMASHHQAEAGVGAVLPDQVAPRLWWSLDVDGWLVLAFEDVSGREPDLSPGSPDVPVVLDALRRLPEVLTPCPWPAAATAAEDLAREFHAWNELIGTPPEGMSVWARQHAADLARIEGLFIEHAVGDTLLHTDLRADNMLIDDAGEVRVIDWSWAVRGAGWLDVAFMVPQLILAGHAPRDAEKTLSCLPAWQQAPADALTSFAAAVTGVWERGRLAEGPDHLRAYRQRAVQAGVAWVEHRLRS